MPRTRRKTALKKLKKNRLPILLVLAGVLLILLPVVTQIKPGDLSGFRTYQTTKTKEVNEPVKANAGPFKISETLLSDKIPSQPPQRIVIPGYKLDLPIVEAKVVDGFWEISETTASHGVGSANPGEIGNTVVFAHARDDLFGPLRGVKKDDEIYLLTKDSWHKYKVTETKLVNPEDVEVVAQTENEILTLFTCSGFLDSKRLIVKAVPLG